MTSHLRTNVKQSFCTAVDCRAKLVAQKYLIGAQKLCDEMAVNSLSQAMQQRSGMFTQRMTIIGNTLHSQKSLLTR